MPSNPSALQPSLGMPGLSAGSGPLDRLSLHPLGAVPLGQHGSSLAPPSLPTGLPGSSMHQGLSDSADGQDDTPPMKRAKASFAGARPPDRERRRGPIRMDLQRARIQ
jgi:hypothetical protein